MRQKGFKGSGGKFKSTHGDYEVHVDVQKSVHNTKTEVAFTFNLAVLHTPSPWPNGVWTERLGTLTPDRADTWWTISPESPANDVADSVISVLISYGLPAIEAVIQVGVMPRLRTACPDIPDTPWDEFLTLHERKEALGDRLQVCTANELFEMLDDDFSRTAALNMIGRRAMDDPRSLPALSQALASDPDVANRKVACDSLTHVQGHPELDELFLSASTDDDQRLRWLARYARLLRSGTEVAPAP